MPDGCILERGLAHDAARRALAEARLDALASSIPEDLCNRYIAEEQDRLAQEERRQWREHPIRMIEGCVRDVLFFVCVLFLAFVQPRRRKPQSQPQDQPRCTPQKAGDLVRREIVGTWTLALRRVVREMDGQRIVLDHTLFPPFLRGEVPAFPGIDSWVDTLPTIGMLVTREALLDLVEIFATQVKATIDADGPLELPSGITVRKDGEQYIAERSAA